MQRCVWIWGNSTHFAEELPCHLHHLSDVKVGRLFALIVSAWSADFILRYEILKNANNVPREKQK